MDQGPEAERKVVIWLYGPAGAGKTAIERSIAEECEEEGLLAASFFFSRAVAGRNDSSRFVATLAYQLLLSMPQISDPILSAIERDPTIFSRSLSVQMQVLVIAPLTSEPNPLPNIPRVAVVDGVDECGPDGKSQANFLNVLGAAAAKLQHIPLIFLIASRPEFEIRQTFKQRPLNSLMRGLFLDNNYQADDDIRLYLNSKFQEVRQNQLGLGTTLADTWPTVSEIGQLVKNSSGQFIFAATVMKFIDSPRRHPAHRLNIILGLSDAGKETPFAALDALYSIILSAVDDLQQVLQVLTLLVLADDYSDKLRVDVVEQLLGFDVQRALMDMHSLLLVPPPGENSVLRIHHASLYDFLMNQSRSHDLYIDSTQGHIWLCQRWLGVIVDYPAFKSITSISIVVFTPSFLIAINLPLVLRFQIAWPLSILVHYWRELVMPPICMRLDGVYSLNVRSNREKVARISFLGFKTSSVPFLISLCSIPLP
ncbi:hypothetical protein BJ912DRAFT_311645 [Pholiota molesta]|nr:hypothetical protein BJ912DRAFT_311645 [Pholiota molesta]